MLKKLIEHLKEMDVEDFEMNLDQECPPYGEYMNDCGVMYSVPGLIVYTNLQITFKTSIKG